MAEVLVGTEWIAVEESAEEIARELAIDDARWLGLTVVDTPEKHMKVAMSAVSAVRE